MSAVPFIRCDTSTFSCIISLCKIGSNLSPSITGIFILYRPFISMSKDRNASNTTEINKKQGDGSMSHISKNPC